ncbi:MAG TPA: hypothetical protein PLP84_04820 [Acholeplasmataceae bacterium]|jgi:hypothetical protein|nr:hypothetical protein [Acholeplasmataceae bacterium]HPX72208.1 hypothetical protein [Acholeplasmataceae bacterium]
MKKLFGYLMVILLLLAGVLALAGSKFRLSASELELAEHDLPYVIEDNDGK